MEENNDNKRNSNGNENEYINTLNNDIKDSFITRLINIHYTTGEIDDEDEIAVNHQKTISNN